MRSLPTQLLLNRVTIAVLAIAVTVVGWNLYVAANNAGILTGQVVDAQGRPVVGATIVMTARTVAHDAEVGTTASDDHGRFRFKKHGQYNLILTGKKNDVGTSEPLHIHLYFRNQDVTLDAPLVLRRAATSVKNG